MRLPCMKEGAGAFQVPEQQPAIAVASATGSCLEPAFRAAEGRLSAAPAQKTKTEITNALSTG